MAAADYEAWYQPPKGDSDIAKITDVVLRVAEAKRPPIGWYIAFTIADGPDPTTSTGLAGMAQVLRTRLSAWSDLRVEVDEYRAIDDERVLVLLHAVGGRGKASGHQLTSVASPGADLFHIVDGKVTRLVVYYDRHHALADLGLEG